MSIDIEKIAGDAHAAASRISSHIKRTNLVRSEEFSKAVGANVFFKLENQQTTGSFKLRGATNRVMTLSDAERAKGCVAASSGNHGAAVARALAAMGASGVIFVPEQTSDAKVSKIKEYGGDVRFFGNDGLDTEQHARQFALDNSMLYLSPYNDDQVVAGQGSCGVEILEQLEHIDIVLVAVGGGGLIGGIGAVLKTHDASIRVIGCQPKASDVMAQSVAAGEILDLPSAPTLSDGTAGGIEADSITLPLNQAVVDEFICVDEAEIATAMRRYIRAEGHAIEGAAGVALAALLLLENLDSSANIVVVICGANVTDEKLATVMGDE